MSSKNPHYNVNPAKQCLHALQKGCSSSPIYLSHDHDSWIVFIYKLIGIYYQERLLYQWILFFSFAVILSPDIGIAVSKSFIDYTHKYRKINFIFGGDMKNYKKWIKIATTNMNSKILLLWIGFWFAWKECIIANRVKNDEGWVFCVLANNENQQIWI